MRKKVQTYKTGPARKILVDGEFVVMWVTKDGYIDKDGNLYVVLKPSGKVVRESETTDGRNKIKEKPELNKIFFLDDGTPMQWQVCDDGKIRSFRIDSIAKPTAVVSLSPNHPSRYNKHTGSSKSD